MAQTWTTPVTKSPGNPILSADWNTYVRDNSSYLRNVINESVLGAAAASITFSSIPSTYRHLQLLITGRSDSATPIYTYVRMSFNGDGGANYYYEELNINNATVGSSSAVAQTGLVIGAITNSTNTADRAGVIDLTIPRYAGTTFHKSFTSLTQAAVTSVASGQYNFMHGGTWASTAAITSITLAPNSGNFIAGTVVTLYGLYI